MSDQPVRTHLETDRGTMPFQEYFVRERCEPRVQAIHYRGAERAKPSPVFDEVLHDPGLSAIILCPSNPYFSIGPILAIPEIRQRLRAAGCPVIGVSPIVEGQALKGPTGKIMAELGIPVSAEAVAEHYKGLVNAFVVDQKDSRSAEVIEKMGIRCLAANTIMHSVEDRFRLAADVLAFAGKVPRT
jgi:LPPG:FO 2-phospho-L-lactate transferase